MRLYRTGVKTTQADGSIKSIALHQGSLDGACAVYSTIISLMCLQQINIEDVNSYSGNVDKRSPKGKFLSKLLAYIIHSGFISGYQNRYGDNLKPPTNVYHRMTA